MPPAVLDLHVVAPDKRPVHVWLPIFLLWPFLLVLGVLVLLGTIIADVVLLALGESYHHYTLLLVRSIGALGDARGTVIRINDGRTTVDMTVQ